MGDLLAHWSRKRPPFASVDADAATAAQATRTSASTSGPRTSSHYFTSIALSRYVNEV